MCSDDARACCLTPVFPQVCSDIMSSTHVISDGNSFTFLKLDLYFHHLSNPCETPGPHAVSHLSAIPGLSEHREAEQDHTHLARRQKEWGIRAGEHGQCDVAACASA